LPGRGCRRRPLCRIRQSGSPVREMAESAARCSRSLGASCPAIPAGEVSDSWRCRGRDRGGQPSPPHAPVAPQSSRECSVDRQLIGQAPNSSRRPHPIIALRRECRSCSPPRRLMNGEKRRPRCGPSSQGARGTTSANRAESPRTRSSPTRPGSSQPSGLGSLATRPQAEERALVDSSGPCGTRRSKKCRSGSPPEKHEIIVRDRRFNGARASTQDDDRANSETPHGCGSVVGEAGHVLSRVVSCNEAVPI
jgi:hypothetical protein